MAASTCLHPYQNIFASASERDAPLFGAEDRDGRSANSPCSATSQSHRLIALSLREAKARADEVLSLKLGDVVLDCG